MLVANVVPEGDYACYIINGPTGEPLRNANSGPFLFVNGLDTRFGESYDFFKEPPVVPSLMEVLEKRVFDALRVVQDPDTQGYRRTRDCQRK